MTGWPIIRYKVSADSISTSLAHNNMHSKIRVLSNNLCHFYLCCVAF